MFVGLVPDRGNALKFTGGFELDKELAHDGLSPTVWENHAVEVVIGGAVDVDLDSASVGFGVMCVGLW
jgi:hypothetical protein